MDRSVAWRIVEAALLAVEGKAANRDSINLKAEYDLWNRKVWGGELPDIPLKWDKSKKSLARVRFRGEEVVDLIISDFYAVSHESFTSTLLHEQIHIWLAIKGQHERQHHGPLFKAKANEIAKRTGFEIPTTEDATHFGLTTLKSVEQMKTYLVALYPGLEGGRQIQVYDFGKKNPAQLADTVVVDIKLLIGFKIRPPDWLVKAQIKFVLSNDPRLEAFNIRRGYKPGTQQADSDLFNTLLQSKEVPVKL